LIINFYHKLLRKRRIIKYFFLLCVLGRGVGDNYLRSEKINDGSIEMYSQVTHTGNVVFINEFEEVFYPCRSRDPSGCPVTFPSLGFLFKRHSEDVVELGEGKGFWCRFSSLKMPEGHKPSDNFPINWCHKSGWVEGVKPKSFTNKSNIGEPHAIIMHPAVIEND